MNSLSSFRHRARILAAAVLTLLAQPVIAQSSPPITPTGDGLAVTLAGHRVTMPPPVWTVPSDVPIDQARTRFTQIAPNVESLVLLPIGTTVVTWNELMGVLVVNEPGYSAERQLASVIDPISEVCRPDDLYASNVGQNEREVVLVICGRYRLNADVPKRCGGGIILATVLQSPAGAAKIYHEWCTSSFDAENRATWPVSETDLLHFAEILVATASLEPVPATAGQ